MENANANGNGSRKQNGNRKRKKKRPSKLRLAKRNERLAREVAVTVVDCELEVRYEYPDGQWHRPPGWDPRS